MNDIYRVRVDGGTPMAVSADRYTSEFFARPSPDGERVAFSARGNGAGAVVAQRTLASRRVGALAAARRRRRRATSSSPKRGAKQMWPMWMRRRQEPLSSCPIAAARQNIWTLPTRRQRRGRSPVSPTAACCGRPSRTTAGRSSSSATSRCGRWTRRAARRRRSRSRVAARRPSPSLEHVTLTNGFQDLALSPDGRKIAFVARGEVWAASRATAATPCASRARRARVADRLAPRQPPHRLRVGARRRVAPLPVTTSRPTRRRS